MKTETCAKKSRDNIPASVKQALLKESGFSCSICGKIPIIFHHIEEWASEYSNDLGIHFTPVVPACKIREWSILDTRSEA